MRKRTKGKSVGLFVARLAVDRDGADVGAPMQLNGLQVGHGRNRWVAQVVELAGMLLRRVARCWVWLRRSGSLGKSSVVSGKKLTSSTSQESERDWGGML